ncbi:hypothetical protein C0J45_19416 [Silurus meridionalis]|nr:hypothetical protein C0J45_19416 [Silurus meridionalis]
MYRELCGLEHREEGTPLSGILKPHFPALGDHIISSGKILAIDRSEEFTAGNTQQTGTFSDSLTFKSRLDSPLSSRPRFVRFGNFVLYVRFLS